MAVSTPTAAPLEMKPVLLFSAGAAVIALALGIFEWRFAPLRVETARLLRLELAAESNAFCQKHGVPASA